MGAGIITRKPTQARVRTVVKTLLYRVFMLCITVIVALFVTGNTGEALSIGLATNLLKTGTYYAYERVWDHVAWGVTLPNS